MDGWMDGWLDGGMDGGREDGREDLALQVHLLGLELADFAGKLRLEPLVLRLHRRARSRTRVSKRPRPQPPGTWLGS
eukprot:1225987-Rhodomonas_salina.1